MAKDEEKELTPEEQRALIVKNTLESKLIQNSAGANTVLTNQSLYGALGVQSAQAIYDKTMSGDEAKKIKEEEYQKKVRQYKESGVFGEPSYPSNSDLSYKLMTQLNEVMELAKLSELEKAIKETGTELEFEVPEELKDYIHADLIKKAYNPEKGEVVVDSLDEKEKHALSLYQTLSESYKRACALKISMMNAFADLNEQGKKIADLYRKKENKK
jgi:hypothetical protein